MVRYTAKLTVALRGLATPDSCDWWKAWSRDWYPAMLSTVPTATGGFFAGIAAEKQVLDRKIWAAVGRGHPALPMRIMSLIELRRRSYLRHARVEVLLQAMPVATVALLKCL